MNTYLITEPYDGCHVRILASGRTVASAEKQFAAECSIRAKGGYGFFSPIRRVWAQRREVANMKDSQVANLPRWDEDSSP